MFWLFHMFVFVFWKARETGDLWICHLLVYTPNLRPYAAPRRPISLLRRIPKITVMRLPGKPVPSQCHLLMVRWKGSLRCGHLQIADVMSHFDDAGSCQRGTMAAGMSNNAWNSSNHHLSPFWLLPHTRPMLPAAQQVPGFRLRSKGWKASWADWRLRLWFNWVWCKVSRKCWLNLQAFLALFFHVQPFSCWLLVCSSCEENTHDVQRLHVVSRSKCLIETQ